jgi:hypothetical protein
MTSVAPKNELLIWWTTDSEAAVQIGFEASAHLPEYIREQFKLRRRNCFLPAAPQKILWVDKKFGAREITDWPDTNIAHMLRDDTSQGIVFAGGDLPLFKGVPGLVTDFRLHLLVI